MEARRRVTPNARLARLWPADEAELVQRAKRERAAFGELYRRHYDAIGAYLLRRTGDAHVTEDLLSEVFLAAMAALGRYRHRGIPFRHWLYRIATRAATRWAVRARRHVSLESEQVVDPSSVRAHADDERVTRAMLRLKAKHQEVLALHYLEGLSVDEVAQVLSVRPGTVKSRLKRARDELRARLGNPS